MLQRSRIQKGKTLQLLLLVLLIISSIYGFVKTLQVIENYPDLGEWDPNYFLLPGALMLIGMILLRVDQSAGRRFQIACLSYQSSRSIPFLLIISCFSCIFYSHLHCSFSITGWMKLEFGKIHFRTFVLQDIHWIRPPFGLVIDPFHSQ